MELKDFDANLKQKLEARRISPSVETWEKLAQKLDEDAKKPKKTFWWMAIAAVFVCGILLGGFIFDPSSEKNTQLVNETVENPSSEEIQIPEKEPIFQKNAGIVTGQKSHVQKPEKTVEKIFPSEIKKETAVAQPMKPILTTISKEEIFETENFPAIQNEKLASHETPEMDEIEKLLNAAQNELENRAFLLRPTNEINAQALLEAVETKPDQPMKDRIFSTVRNTLEQLASSNRIFD